MPTVLMADETNSSLVTKLYETIGIELKLWINFVDTKLGQTACITIPFDSYSTAKDLENWMTKALPEKD